MNVVDGNRAALVTRAFRAVWLTIAWLALEAGVAGWSAIAAHSLSLLAFSADSGIEMLSAGILIWRLRVEMLNGQKFSERTEHLAARAGGILLFMLALYVIVSAAVSLWSRQGQDFSWSGLAITFAAIPVMYAFARTKTKLADQLGSRALRTDAVESIACCYLAAAVVIGLVVQRSLGAWWVDGVTSLVLVGFLVKEGFEAWEAD